MTCGSTSSSIAPARRLPIPLPLPIGRPPRWPIVCALLALLAAGPRTAVHAQTVVELQGGGSSLYEGYGLSANIFRPDFDGWIGAGYLRGFRVGAFLRTSFGRDTVRVGSDALLVRFPTDLFTPGYNLLVSGASVTRVRDGASATFFAGASVRAANGGPGFQPLNFEEPLLAFNGTQRLSPRVTTFAHAQVATTRTAIGGLQWRPAEAAAVGLTGGIGSDDPYGAASVQWKTTGVDLRVSYVLSPERFRRLTVPAPLQAETDRENIQLVLEPAPGLVIGGGRQNFVQDSARAGEVQRATGNSVFAGYTARQWRVSAGLYDSRAASGTNLATYAAAGATVASWLDVEAFALQSRPSTGDATTTPVLNLRERISPRVSLLQQLSLENGRPRIQFGGTLIAPIGEIGVDYQIVQQPFRPLDPFRSALTLTARLQLGPYSTRLGTFIQPDGTVGYSAQGSTFLYLGEFGGVQPNRVGGATAARFVVKGRVVDEDGRPVDGAAIVLDDEYAYSNAQGEFLIRIARPKALALRVALDEFLLPGAWEVVEAPATAQAEREEKVQPVRIVLRRVAVPRSR